MKKPDGENQSRSKTPQRQNLRNNPNSPNANSPNKAKNLKSNKKQKSEEHKNKTDDEIITYGWQNKENKKEIMSFLLNNDIKFQTPSLMQRNYDAIVKITHIDQTALSRESTPETPKKHSPPTKQKIKIGDVKSRVSAVWMQPPDFSSPKTDSNNRRLSHFGPPPKSGHGGMRKSFLNGSGHNDRDMIELAMNLTSTNHKKKNISAAEELFRGGFFDPESVFENKSGEHGKPMTADGKGLQSPNSGYSITLTVPDSKKKENIVSSPNYLKDTNSTRRKSKAYDSASRKPSWIPQVAPTKIDNLTDNLNSRFEKSFMNVIHQDMRNVEPSQVTKENVQATYKKAVRALYERVDLLSSEELVFYYKFIINKAKLLYLDFLKKKGVDL